MLVENEMNLFRALAMSIALSISVASAVFSQSVKGDAKPAVEGSSGTNKTILKEGSEKNGYSVSGEDRESLLKLLGIKYKRGNYSGKGHLFYQCFGQPGALYREVDFDDGATEFKVGCRLADSPWIHFGERVTISLKKDAKKNSYVISSLKDTEEGWNRFRIFISKLEVPRRVIKSGEPYLFVRCKNGQISDLTMEIFNPLDDSLLEPIPYRKQVNGFGVCDEDDDFQDPRVFRVSVGFRF